MARSPRIFTLISAVACDRMPEGAVEISDPSCPLSWASLPPSAQRWAEEQGYGSDDAELLYVLPGDAEVTGWPIYRLSAEEVRRVC